VTTKMRDLQTDFKVTIINAANMLHIHVNQDNGRGTTEANATLRNE
jgi:uncharacterized protein (DUF849 family)